MRICLVSHGFPPLERTGVENYTAGLAAALTRAGHHVEVFAPRRDEGTAELALHREERDDGYGVTWVTVNRVPGNPREVLSRPLIAERFGQFLERERPDLVHFQHVVKLGVEMVGEAADRGIPTVYTAHDYYAVCHRYTLLRPDLAHCEVRGDSMACALCDVSLGYLNGFEELGDYQMGVLRDQVGDERWANLTSLLDDDPEPAGLSVDMVDEAYDLRRDLDSLRGQAYWRLDRIIAPTKFLADELARGGLLPERIEVLPYGIENEDLLDVPPVRSGDGPVRFGFFGGLSKHKGVHHLLEGFALVNGEALLSIWGYSSDTPYVDLLRAQADRVGAQWLGSYEREVLPELLAEVDVVVVPSTWVENYPLVIREAFSAKRPVIAFDFGALPESVRDGVDGYLVEPRSASALAEAMQRFVDDSDLASRLAGAIEPVKGIDEQARELLERYEPLVLEARKTRTEEGVESPPSVASFRARVEELSDLPLRVLFERARAGLTRLEGELGMDRGPERRDLEYEWIREKLEGAQTERDWAERAQKSMEGDLAYRAETIGHQQHEIESLREERDYLRSELEYFQAELERRNEEYRRTAAELVRVAELRDTHEADMAALHAQLDAAEAGGEELRAALQKAEHSLGESEGFLRATAELGSSALRAQEALIAAEVGPFIDLVHYLAGTDRAPADGEDPFLDLVEATREGRETALRLAEELGWRRDQMAGLAHSARKKLLWPVLRRIAVGRRIEGWPWPPSASGPAEGGESE